MKKVGFSYRMEEENNSMMKDSDEQPAKLTIIDSTPDLRYGWGRFRPECMQVFNNPKWFMFFLTIFSSVQGKFGPFPITDHVIVIRYWIQNLAIVMPNCFKIESVIRYEVKKFFVIRD